MLNAPLIRKVITSLVCSLVILGTHMAGMVAFAFDGPTTAGTVISNRAEATYRDESGASYAVVSPTVTVTILAVSTLALTPDETVPSATVASHELITRVFRICNTGNVSDAYQIVRAEVGPPANLVNLYFDNDNSGTVTDADSVVQVNESISATISPGACLGVLAVVDTNDSPANSNLTIRLTARSNSTNAAGRRSEDDGTIINAVGSGARLTSPNSANLPPLKTVNGVKQAVVSADSTFTYAISFRNSGDTPARGVVVTDDLATSLEYVAGSLSLDNKALTDAEDTDEANVQDHRIVVQLAEVLPDRVVTISFKARFAGNIPAAVGVPNFASFTGQNIPPTKSSSAIVVIDPSAIVFAGRSGSAAPISGAQVEILLDQDGNNRLNIPPGVGFPPNVQNDNPYTTDGLGRFSFALLPEQMGSDASPVRYFIKVTAPGYSTRMLEITVRPSQAGFFTLTVHALDTQPLARAGGFDLVRENVGIDNITTIAFNIPMFEPQGLEITKSTDRARAEIGDAIGYRLEIHNPTAVPVIHLMVHDRLPVSFQYVAGTGRFVLNSAAAQPIEPEVVGDEMVFRVGEIGPGARARLLYRARVGANAREGEQENVAFASGIFPSGEREQTPSVRATVTVGSGVFSTRQIIVGRVFVDVNRDGKFDEGDKPLPDVRLYLNSGQSVVTDSQGLYNFPSLGDGAQVLSVDPVSLPERYALADGGMISGRSWTRLLRTPLGGGALLRQDFVVIPSPQSQHPTPAKANDANRKRTGAVPVALATNEIAENSGDGRVGGPQAAPVRIVWDQKPSASRYRIQLASDAGFRDVMFDGPVSSNEYVATGLAPGRYYWRVATANPEANHFSKPAVIDVKSLTIEEYVATASVDPVAPGEVEVLTPTANEVVMSPAMQLDARVALNWTVKLEVNGKAISDKDIGTTRQDNKNSVTTYTYVGIELRPGPNSVRVTPISPAGEAGRPSQLTVLGRGPARRLEILTDKTEIQADGRDSTIVRVSAYDHWGSPAADDQVALETSAGELLRVDDQTGKQKATNEASAGINSSLRPDASVLREQRSAQQTQVIVSLIGGQAKLKLVASGAPGEAKLRAQMGQTESEAKVRITPESRPAILVGLAEMTVGQSVPEVNLRGEEGSFRSRLSFFYSGRVGQHTLLTVSYDSQRPINRTAGRDRLFQLDPRDRVYPLFGDSSTRYEAAQSNSKLYARLDHNRSYAMFGDFDADMEDLALTGYARKLTGVKLHAENAQGDFLTVSGARPDTAFARDVFPAGGLGLLQLSHGEILPGSETVVIEVRDRRNPELIISRETLARSVDYNLNSIAGELFFLRYISTFDFSLNLVQLVVTYEHRASSLSSAVYTARAKKSLKGLGLQLGLAGVVQRQDDTGSFMLAGFDGEKSLPHKGTLRFAFARSQGEIIGTGNSFAAGDNEHDGNAYQLELNQPFPLYEGAVRARYSYASAGFLNPFGATVTPGSQRGEVAVELKPRASSMLHFGLTDERNRTEKVDNSRVTLSAAWDQIVHERLRFHLGYDHRSLNDESSARTTDSNLVTGAVDVKLTDNLQLAVKREQNMGDADPTYPDQTTLAATYKLNQWTKVFLTQRLASTAITPIGDFSAAGAGFASTGSRHETAVGVETRLGKYSSMVGRYQLENGINGTDSFAVIGLQNHLPITKQFSLELGFERGFHLAGNGESFNSASLGFGWQPNKDFRASARYEFRDRSGQGQLLALGAAGRISESITALSRFQLARTGFEGHNGSSMEGMAALAIRSLNSDRAGLLFSFDHRSLIQNGSTGLSLVQTRDRIDSLSSDGYFQATKNLELYARLALRFSANGQADLPFVSTLTYLSQVRAQYRLSRRFDWAGEQRLIVQPSSGTQRSVYGAELGLWALPDLRLGLGYNFNAAGEPAGVTRIPRRRGFYFTVSSKLSNLFDLFGTSQNGFVGTGKDQPDNPGVQP